MNPTTSKASYRNHKYSGPKKNLKRCRALIKRHHGDGVGRSFLWRKKPRIDGLPADSLDSRSQVWKKQKSLAGDDECKNKKKDNKSKAIKTYAPKHRTRQVCVADDKDNVDDITDTISTTEDAPILCDEQDNGNVDGITDTVSTTEDTPILCDEQDNGNVDGITDTVSTTEDTPILCDDHDNDNLDGIADTVSTTEDAPIFMPEFAVIESADPLGSEDVKPLACRACLAIERPLRPLQRALATVYGDLTGTTVSESDIYPKFVCSYCRALLAKFAAFRARCLSAQTTLCRIHSAGAPITQDLIKSGVNFEAPYPNLQTTYTQQISIDQLDIDISTAKDKPINSKHSEPDINSQVEPPNAQDLVSDVNGEVKEEGGSGFMEDYDAEPNTVLYEYLIDGADADVPDCLTDTSSPQISKQMATSDKAETEVKNAEKPLTLMVLKDSLTKYPGCILKQKTGQSKSAGQSNIPRGIPKNTSLDSKAAEEKSAVKVVALFTGAKFEPIQLRTKKKKGKGSVTRQRKRKGLFICEICGCSFTYRAFSRHLQIHTPKQSFQCDHCGKHFGRKDNLRAHILHGHMGVKWPKQRPPATLECHICQKKCRGKAKLLRHERLDHHTVCPPDA